jgi:thymidylate synthase
MPNEPWLIVTRSFQIAWVEAARHLSEAGGSTANLVVHVKDVTAFNSELHDRVTSFAKSIDVLPPKDVAYTVFPHTPYWQSKSAAEIYRRYNETGGFYDRSRRRPHSGWGTYFRRMTHYERPNGEIVNQLDKVISAIRNWKSARQAAYAIVIAQPGPDTARPEGSPCLSYIAPQVTIGDPLTVGLLCVYRNHDFVERAYGNYWGLCELAKFIARETGAEPGALTCVSSHAYVPSHKRQLRALLDSLV